MKKPNTVIIGSTSRIKEAAVRRALRDLGIEAEVRALETSSGMKAQPFGIHEAMTGARNRVDAHRNEDTPDTTWFVGIENAVIGFAPRDGAFDVAAICVAVGGQGPIRRGFSPTVEMPNSCIEEAGQRGFSTTTVGEVIAERLEQCDPLDPHATITGGAQSREDSLVAGLLPIFGLILSEAFARLD